MRDWVAWHEGYDDPSSGLSARLTLVKQHLAGALDQAPAGPARLLSLCAGQGRDGAGGGRLRYHTGSEKLRSASGIAAFTSGAVPAGLLA